jgi:hypothetical protein
MISGYGQPARFAVMPAVPERFGHRSAARAALRSAWCVNLHSQPGSLRRFPEQDEDERAPGRIQDRLGEPAARQALDVQVFDRNQAVAVDQHAGDFVRSVISSSSRAFLSGIILFRRPASSASCAGWPACRRARLGETSHAPRTSRPIGFLIVKKSAPTSLSN